MSLPNSPDDAELVPELSTWSQQLGEEIRLEEWIGVVGDPKLAIGYLRVFWPPFVAHEGGVFLQRQFTEQSFGEWQVVLGEEALPEIEKAMNHLPLMDLFTEPEKQAKLRPEELRHIGALMRDIWGAKLRQDFSGREFVVEFTEGEAIEDFVITFHHLAQ